ncbi:MAG: O-antigen ligase family protein [Ardenticatenaceae bacterium]|nr:O-antigen ligase family protein [Ardenticatenaceae bacterium]
MFKDRKLHIRACLIFLGILGFTSLGWWVSYLANNFNLSSWLLIVIICAGVTFPIFLLFNEKFIITLVFLALAYPYRLRIPIGPLNSFTLVEILLVAAWVAILVRRIFIAKNLTYVNRNIRSSLHFQALDLTIFVYSGIGLLSLIWAASIPLAIRGLIVVFENVAFYYLIVVVTYFLPEQTKYLNRLFIGLGIFAISLSILFFFGGFSFLDILPPESGQELLSVKTRLGSPAWGRSNYFASALLLFLPTYVSLAFLSPRLRNQIGFGVIAVISIAVFVFTWSRGGYIALAIALLVLFFLFIWNGKLTLGKILFFIFSIILFGLSFSLAIDYMVKFNPIAISGIDRLLSLNDQNIQARLLAWSGVWDYVTKNVLGVGLGNSSLLEHLLTIANAHNAYLQILLETGWIGITILFFLLGFMFKENITLFRHLKGTIYEPLGYGLLASFVAVLVNIAFESSFEGVIFGWLFWTTQGLVRMLNNASFNGDNSWQKEVG